MPTYTINSFSREPTSHEEVTTSNLIATALPQIAGFELVIAAVTMGAFLLLVILIIVAVIILLALFVCNKKAKSVHINVSRNFELNDNIAYGVSNPTVYGASTPNDAAALTSDYISLDYTTVTRF